MTVWLDTLTKHRSHILTTECKILIMKFMRKMNSNVSLLWEK